MKHLSLFSGIGGFDLAAHWMGWENVAAVEKEPFCQKVLKKNFPKLKIYGDIKEFNGKPYKGTINIISGGFPCQPFSVSGRGDAQKDDRHLWPQMLRIIKEIRPQFVVGENVTGIVNLALDQVLLSLENEGYQAEVFIIPACAVNAPHRRDRVWIVAHSLQVTANIDQCSSSGQKRKRAKDRQRALVLQKNGAIGSEKHLESNSTKLAANPKRPRQSKPRQHKKPINQSSNKKQKTNRANDVGGWPTQSPFCRANDGISDRVDRLKALGNAIVPQVAFQIFKAIQALKNNQ